MFNTFRLVAILFLVFGFSGAAYAMENLDGEVKAITAALDAGQVDKAVAAAQILTKSHPKLSVAYSTLGKTLVYRGDYLGAIKPLRKALQYDANNATAHWYLGSALAGEGKEEEGKKEYAIAVKLRPKLLKGKGCADCDWLKRVTGH